MKKKQLKHSFFLWLHKYLVSLSFGKKHHLRKAWRRHNYFLCLLIVSQKWLDRRCQNFKKNKQIQIQIQFICPKKFHIRSNVVAHPSSDSWTRLRTRTRVLKTSHHEDSFIKKIQLKFAITKKLQVINIPQGLVTGNWIHLSFEIYR